MKTTELEAALQVREALSIAGEALEAFGYFAKLPEQRQQLEADTGKVDSALPLAQQLVDYHSRSEWQPIETAPKDGTEVDLWQKINNAIVGMRRVNCLYREPNSDEPKCYGLGFAWRDGYGEPINNATHWMPLPTAPVQPKQGETQEGIYE